MRVEVLSLRHILEIKDASGRSLAEIKHKLLTVTDAMEVESGLGGRDGAQGGVLAAASDALMIASRSASTASITKRSSTTATAEPGVAV
jgi:hypothetical protein